MTNKLIEDLKKFRHNNLNAFFDVGVIETKMYINSGNYVSFEIKTFRTTNKINSVYRKSFDKAIENFKELYDYADSKYFNECKDDYTVQEYRYLVITKKGKK